MQVRAESVNKLNASQKFTSYKLWFNSFDNHSKIFNTF